MNLSRTNRLMLSALVVLAVIVGIYSAYNYLTSFVEVKITSNNVSKIEIADVSDSLEDSEKTVKEDVATGESSVRLKKGYSYLIKYTGADGYADGVEKLALQSSGKEVKIDPYFSEKKLAGMTDAELPLIQSQFAAKYKNSGLYDVQKGKLYRFGEWYGTTLKYKGPDEYNSDTLRIVLHKEGANWTIKTAVPDITLSKYTFPDVPEDVLRATNAL